MTDSSCIIKNALTEISLKQISLIEKETSSDISTDEHFDDKIQKLIYGKGGKSFIAKRIAISLAAAIIITISVMMSITAIRTKIVDFFVEVYDTFTEFFIDDADSNNYPKTIEAVYMPSYLTENNYEVIFNDNDGLISLTIWSNGTSSANLTQTIIDESNSSLLDTEDASFQTIFVNNTKIFYKTKNNTLTAKWLAYGYMFDFNCNENLGLDTLEEIILSIKPSEN